MSGKPAARLTDPTACPVPGHSTNPIAVGSPDVLFDGLPAARLSDPSACGGALSGNLASTVFINGLNAATVGSTGSHGNVVIGGSGTVIIGDSVSQAPFTPIQSLVMPSTFDEQFELLDAEGEPVADFRYKITSASGTVFRGVTDSLGRTQRINTRASEKLQLEPDDIA